MTRKERQADIIEKVKKQKQVEKIRKRRWGLSVEEAQNSLLLEAKIILGLVIIAN